MSRTTNYISQGSIFIKPKAMIRTDRKIAKADIYAKVVLGCIVQHNGLNTADTIECDRTKPDVAHMRRII